MSFSCGREQATELGAHHVKGGSGVVESVAEHMGVLGGSGFEVAITPV